MKLRKATFNDWKDLLDWRNDPIAKKNSFNRSLISEKTHKEWLTRSLELNTRSIFILEDENSSPVGMIRSDNIQDNIFLLSWNISPRHRGKGYGSLILHSFLQNRNGIFVAEIKPTNIASIKIAEKNGFIKENDHQYKKHQ